MDVRFAELTAIRIDRQFAMLHRLQPHRAIGSRDHGVTTLVDLGLPDRE